MSTPYCPIETSSSWLTVVIGAVSPKAHSGSATQHIKDTEPTRHFLPRRQISASDQNRILETIAWHFTRVLSLGCPSTRCTLTPALKRRGKIDQFECSVEQIRKHLLPVQLLTWLEQAYAFQVLHARVRQSWPAVSSVPNFAEASKLKQLRVSQNCLTSKRLGKEGACCSLEEVVRAKATLTSSLQCSTTAAQGQEDEIPEAE